MALTTSTMAASPTQWPSCLKDVKADNASTISSTNIDYSRPFIEPFEGKSSYSIVVAVNS